MKITLVLVAVCLIALSCAAPVEDAHEREKRSSSGESNRGGPYMPSFFPYNPYPSSNSNSMQNIMYALLLSRLLAPAPAPAAPATGK